LLDEPGADEQLVLRSVRDIVTSNALFGGTRAAVREVLRLLAEAQGPATLLDVGTGLADVPRRAARAAERRGIALRTLGLDADPVLAAAARAHVSHAICACATALPLADASVDIVLCSQTLHHFRGDRARALLAEMTRVARVGAVVSDLRRSWAAAAGFWAASFPLRFHPVTRHDGVVSVLRGYTPPELARLVHDATGTWPEVRRHAGFRLTATWRVAR